MKRCPHCGEPARAVVLTARTRFELLPDGSRGRVLRATPLRTDNLRQYECGGRHVWTDTDNEQEHETS